MAIFNILEIIDVIIMSSFIGFIFYRYFARFNVFRRHDQDHLYHGMRFNWSDFMFSIYLIVPAIVLHELGHKFVAISFGYQAIFHSPISIQHLLNPFLLFTDFFALLMVIAVITTYLGGTFLFFVPAYVSFSALATPLQTTFIAFAGPFLNLILWLLPMWLVKSRKIPHKYIPFVILTSKINMLLFIFNMLPIPGFDGFKVYAGLFKLLF